MDEQIDRARIRSQVRRDKRHLLTRNEGRGGLHRLSEEELEERDEAFPPSLNYAIRPAAYRAELMRREVVLQRERMEELNGNLVRQRVQMATLNGTLNRLMRITVFATVI